MAKKSKNTKVKAEAAAPADTTAETTEQPEMTLEQRQRVALFNVFEQGARTCNDWGVANFRLQCLASIQQVEDISNLAPEHAQEVLGVLTELLQKGLLTFEAQSLLIPSVIKLFEVVPAPDAAVADAAVGTDAAGAAGVAETVGTAPTESVTAASA